MSIAPESARGSVSRSTSVRRTAVLNPGDLMRAILLRVTDPRAVALRAAAASLNCYAIIQCETRMNNESNTGKDGRERRAFPRRHRGAAFMPLQRAKFGRLSRLPDALEVRSVKRHECRAPLVASSPRWKKCGLHLALCVVLAGFVALASPLNAGVRKIELPPESASFKPAPGAEIANAQCLTCHSMEYVLTQPHLTGTYWASAVKKMREKFGATIPEDQVEPLVKYLTENYGAQTNSASHIPSTTEVKAVPASVQNGSVESLATRYGCLSCHNVNVKIVGPAYKDVAAKYRTDPAALDKISRQIHDGGSGKWGPVIMPPFPMLTDAEAKMLGSWIMSQGGPK